jgi:hypothetical protein
MIHNLGYSRVTQRDLVNGKAVARPYEVDVHANRYSPTWHLITLIYARG